jgi:TfoX/Sxy family transcriptional regulator of competence genes
VGDEPADVDLDKEERAVKLAEFEARKVEATQKLTDATASWWRGTGEDHALKSYWEVPVDVLEDEGKLRDWAERAYQAARHAKSPRLQARAPGAGDR